MDKTKRFKAFFGWIICLIFASCASGKPMTADLYSDISIGTTEQELRQMAGSPIEIKHHSSDDEYIYVERITMGTCRVLENYYSFFLQDGKVVRKSIKTHEPPAFNLIYTEDPNNPCN